MQKISVFKPRENNLQIEQVDIPLQSLVLLTGPSGSGKSSLAIDTILLEGQRRCFEALKSTLPMGNKTVPRPNVSKISNLPPTFGMKQDTGLTFHPRTSIASLLGLHSLLAQVFIQEGVLHCPVTNAPLKCFTPSEVMQDLLRYHSKEACHILLAVNFSTEKYTDIIEELKRQNYARIRHDDTVYFIEDAPAVPPTKLWIVLDRLKITPQNNMRCTEAIQKGFLSVNQSITIMIRTASGNIDKSYARFPYSNATQARYPIPEMNHLSPASALGACPDCAGHGYTPTVCNGCCGTGLNDIASMLKIQDLSFANLLSYSPNQAKQSLQKIIPRDPRLDEMTNLLTQLENLDIVLPLHRRIQTLSTGERSRVRLCSVLGQQLGQVLYVLDEPSLGLDDSGVLKTIHLLQGLQSAGQSFIVVDHHPLFLEYAEHVIHIGPRSGVHGGRIIKGPVIESPLTREDLPEKEHPHCLLTSPIPIYQHAIHVISGPSGSGKTRLLHQLHETFKSMVRTPVYLLSELGSSGNKRSCVATIIGIWGDIRTLIASTKSAKLNRIPASNFSFNRRGGRCEECLGLGSVPQNMPPLPPVEISCPECQGRRFNEITLQATYRDHNISNILSMSIDECCKLFEHQPSLFRYCQALQMVGLGYLTLGQTSPTLSGGEHRRIQLAKILAPCLKKEHTREHVILLLDDPTAALHSTDAIRLQRTLINLRSADTTVILTSNNPQLLELHDFQYHMEEIAAM